MPKKRKIIRVLEQYREDLAVAVTVPCWKCKGDADRRTGCPECGGSGLHPPENGIYNASILGASMGGVVELVDLLMSETADSDMRAIVRWAMNYRIEAVIANSDGTLGEVMQGMADRAATLSGQRSETLDLMAERAQRLGPNPSRKDVMRLMRGDGDEPV